MTSVVLWLMVAWQAFALLLTLTTIGKPRLPLSPNVAAFLVAFNVVYVVGLLYVGGVL